MTTETPPQRVSPPPRPSRLSNPDLKRKAQDAANRLRRLKEGTRLDASACAWLAELVATLANRIPVNTRPRSTSRTGRLGR